MSWRKNHASLKSDQRSSQPPLSGDVLFLRLRIIRCHNSFTEGIDIMLLRASAFLLLSLLLAGCGDGSKSTGLLPEVVDFVPPPDPGVDIEVQPSLGLITGAEVTITRADGEAIEGATGTIGETGIITINHDGSWEGPILVTVTGNDSAMYFDESAGALLPMPAGVSLRAYAPSSLAQVGVTILTELAAQMAANVDGSLNAETINNLNNTVRDTFAPGLADILNPPTLVSETNFTTQELGNDDAGTYALTLAALANLASTSSSPALTILENLTADIEDGDIDGRGFDGALELSYNAADFASLYAAAVELAASTLATADLLDASSSLTVNIDNDLLDALVNTGVAILNSVLELVTAAEQAEQAEMMPPEEEEEEEAESPETPVVDVEVPNLGGDYNLSISGQILTLGIGTDFAVEIQGIPAPSPSDTEAVTQIILDTVAGLSNITNLQVTIINNTAERVTFQVTLDATQSGITVSLDLTYDYTLGSGGSGDESGDSSDDVASGESGNETVDLTALGTLCFFGGEPVAADVPEFLRSNTWNVTFQEAQAGAPYAEGETREFLFSSSGGLFIDNNQVAGTPVTCSGNDSEMIWKDTTNNLLYTVSNVSTSIFNEINVGRGDDGGFLGQFVE